MKLEQFDLEKVIHGVKVVTRDGREVIQLTKFEIEGYPLVGVLDTEISSWTIDGYYEDENNETDRDLFLAVESKRIWVNVYRRFNYTDIYLGNPYTSKQKAINAVLENDPDYIKTIEITDEL